MPCCAATWIMSAALLAALFATHSSQSQTHWAIATHWATHQVHLCHEGSPRGSQHTNGCARLGAAYSDASRPGRHNDSARSCPGRHIRLRYTTKGHLASCACATTVSGAAVRAKIGPIHSLPNASLLTVSATCAGTCIVPHRLSLHGLLQRPVQGGGILQHHQRWLIRAGLPGDRNVTTTNHCCAADLHTTRLAQSTRLLC